MSFTMSERVAAIASCTHFSPGRQCPATTTLPRSCLFLGANTRSSTRRSQQARHASSRDFKEQVRTVGAAAQQHDNSEEPKQNQPLIVFTTLDPYSQLQRSNDDLSSTMTFALEEEVRLQLQRCCRSQALDCSTKKNPASAFCTFPC